MRKQRWNKILCFNELNQLATYYLWGTKKDARNYVKDLRKHNLCVEAYIM